MSEDKKVFVPKDDAASGLRREGPQPREQGCARVGKLFGGCRFEPRFDLIPPEEPPSFSGQASGIVALVHAMTRKNYVKDVCCTCGREVVR